MENSKSRSIRERVIRERVAIPATELAMRKKSCADFRARLRKIKVSALRFSQLTGFGLSTVYSWTSKADRCIPPPVPALRILRMVELDASTVGMLEKVASER